MNATPSELLMRNFNKIFIELDPLKRAALLAESYNEDCLWIHPGGRIVGREGINEAATEIRKHFPEYRYTVTGEIQIMHNVATCRWGSGMPGQPFHYTGTDFLEERDGRLRHRHAELTCQEVSREPAPQDCYIDVHRPHTERANLAGGWPSVDAPAGER